MTTFRVRIVNVCPSERTRQRIEDTVKKLGNKTRQADYRREWDRYWSRWPKRKKA